MIIYREQKQETSPEEYVSRIRNALREYERSGFSGHSFVTEILIEFGEFETAVTDMLALQEDRDDFLKQVFRRAVMKAGRLFYRSWEDIPDGREYLTDRLNESLDRISALPLPRPLLVGIPEGYVYYGLYPETYLEAAKRFHEEKEPKKAVCLGLRNIGASLSAVVAATLEELGCETLTFTLRPRGHPFNRHLSLSRAFERTLAAFSGRHFLIVDEGPGLSGSSFGCTAQKLSELGHPDERIVFFPSWEPEHLEFASARSNDRWRKHMKYSADFEQVCMESGKLFGALSGEFLDLSAGKWRTLFYDNPSEYPAVFPRHERRKYLSHNGFSRKIYGWRADVDPSPSEVVFPRSSGCLLKFSGLGRYGREKRRFAEGLANAGFTPPVLGLVNGFLVTRFVPGRPVAANHNNPGFLDAIAGYLAHLQNTFPRGQSAPFEQMHEMVTANVREGLGEAWTKRLDILETLYKKIDPREATFIDGRMLPHEWIAASGRYLKTDGANHFNDHFFPGLQDIAWDIASVLSEFDFGPREQKRLLRQYISLSGDRDVSARLPFYRIVYLAYRLGYATEAKNALRGDPDGERFGALAARYGSLLRSALIYPTDTGKALFQRIASPRSASVRDPEERVPFV